MKQALIIFAKNPILGQVKTRLAATVGNDTALSVYRQLLAHTVSVTSYLPVEKIICYGTSIEEQDIWTNEIYNKQVQHGDDLGERMKHAFDYAFERGNNEVTIIGADCLEISSAIIMNAFAWLKEYDIVIGPASDGGYYLLAMKQMHEQLFKKISWSTDKVLQQTLAICDAQNLTVHLLPELSDIDTEKDLQKIKERLTIQE